MTATAPPGEGGQAALPNDPYAYVGDEMTLFEHLEELRSRLFKSALAIALGLGVGFVFRDPVLRLLTRPYCELPPALRGISSETDPERCQLIFTDPMGAFFISLKAAAIVAVVLAGPAVCYQIWRFVTPGLRPVERRYALPFILITQLLFASGAVFSYFVIPRALEFLLGFAGEGIVSLMDASRYLSFVLRTMIAFGAAFEFPVVLVVLSLMDVLGSGAMRRYRRHALFGVFVAAAVITPTQDPFTMVVMAAPLVLFYETSILAARLIERRRGKALAAADADAA